MAPILSPSKKVVIEILQKKDYQKYLPLTLGNGSPDAEISLIKENLRFCILGIPEQRQQEVNNIAYKSLKDNNGWMPENAWAFYDEIKCLFKTKNKEDFIQFIKDIEWNYGGSDEYLEITNL